MRRGPPPRIVLTVDKRQSRIANIVSAVLINNCGIGRGGYVERVAADDGFVLECDSAGDEGQLGLWDVGARLQEPPLAAILVGPAAPRLVDVVLGVKGCVVRGVAFVRGLAAFETGLHERDVDVADEVEHLRRQGGGLRGVASGRDQPLDRAGEVRRGRMEGAVGGEIAAVLREGGAVDGGVPVAALPSSDARAERIGEVVVVSGCH